MKTEIGMICLAAVEVAALITHEDGATLLPIAGMISAIAGAAAWPQIKKGLKVMLTE